MDLVMVYRPDSINVGEMFARLCGINYSGIAYFDDIKHICTVFFDNDTNWYTIDDRKKCVHITCKENVPVGFKNATMCDVDPLTDWGVQGPQGREAYVSFYVDEKWVNVKCTKRIDIVMVLCNNYIVDTNHRDSIISELIKHTTDKGMKRKEEEDRIENEIRIQKYAKERVFIRNLFESDAFKTWQSEIYRNLAGTGHHRAQYVHLITREFASRIR